MLDIVEVTVRTIRVVKMKEHVLFCRELSILGTGDRVVVDRMV